MCDWENKIIWISNATLESSERFLGVLLHEISHALSEEGDATKEFESTLTNLLGYVSSSLVSSVGNDPTKVTPAQSLDLKGDGYMRCRCMSCYSTKFDYNEDLTYVKCKQCGREYKGGYEELVYLNKKYIKDNLSQDEINSEVCHDILNKDDEDENHSFEELSKGEHLNVCGIEMKGTVIEMIDKMIKGNLMKPISEIDRII